MSEHAAYHPPDIHERLTLGERGWSIFIVAGALGAVALIIAVVLGFLAHDGFRRFFHVYLTNFMYFLSIPLGGLFFVLIQHVTKAGWSVSVRRLAEIVAATLPVFAVLALPLLLAVILNNGALYPWAAGAHHDDHGEPAAAAVEAQPDPDHAKPAAAGHGISDSKRKWLNIPLFTARLIVYFVIWSGIAVWYWRTSTRQDLTGDPSITDRMQALSPLSLILYAVTVTLAAFDLLMSLDPHWFSTIYGVYYFSGCAVGIFSTLVILAALLQRWGFLRETITAEHYHDLGKFLFGFVFFWGYIAFSQFMLIWYANIPEETIWYGRRGASTVDHMIVLTWPWGAILVALLFGHLLIPFAGLLSRHAKRRKSVLLFWSVWILVFHWIDVSWLVLPEYFASLPENARRVFPYGLMDLCIFLGIGGIFIASLARVAGKASLRAMHDPRLHEAVAFTNI